MRRSRSALLSLSNFSTTKPLAIVLCLLIPSTLSFAAAPDRITASIVSGQMVELARSLHPKAQPQYDQGAVDPQFKFSYVTLLTSPSASQQRALDKLTADQQNPSSPNYHKWLTPEQYADRFGLSQNDINKITTWLKAQGFTVISVGGGRNSIVFSGTAIQVETAFQTQVHRYSVNGEEHFANATAVKIPAAWSGVVTGVRGLNSFRLKPVSIKNRLHRNYYDSNFETDFIAPGDIATIYDINPLYNASTPIDGTGQKLAIIGQTDIYLADINDFRSGFGLSTIPTTGSNLCTTNSSGLVVSPCSTTNFGYVLVTADPGKTYPCGDLSEADLDIEWSGATARNAQIIFVNSPATYDSNCNQTSSAGAEDALSAAINPPTGPPIAPVISMSYNLCELFANDDETELQQANVEGVTVLNSAGDTGAAGCDNFTNSATTPPNLAVGGLAVDYPASSQYVTGVGGSAVPFADLPPFPASATYWGTPNPNPANGGSALKYVPEEGWNDDYEFGAYCAANPTDSFCTSYGITSQLTAQEALGIGAGGGGASNCFNETAQGVCTGGFPQPSWQTVTISGQASARFVPDVSLLATPNFAGYIFCTEISELTLSGTGTGSVCAPGGAAGITNALAFTDPSNNNAPDPSIIGGTSVSAPVFAGMVVLLNQYFQGAASTGLGNINPMLYTLAKTSSNNYFHQLTTGNNQEYCMPGTPTNQPSAWQCPGTGILGFLASNSDTTTGYNLVTGLGSVDLNNLAIAWAASRAASSITIQATPTSIIFGQSVTLAATVASPTTAVGQVTFHVTGAPSSLGTATLNSSGIATLTTTGSLTTLPVGTDSINASFPGDGYNMPSTTTTPAVVTVTEPDFTVPASLAAPPAANPGQSASTTMSISAVGAGTFGSNVTYTCSAGLPTGATCSFSPTQINATTNSPDTVTITVQTAGPFTGPAGGARRRLLGQKQRPWLPLSLPLAGMVLVGFAGRGLPRRYKIAGLCLALGLAGLLVACGGGSSPPPPSVVTVSPSTVNTLYPNLTGAPAQTQQFSAAVSNSTSQTVTWAVSGTGNGSIDPNSGLYTAPVTLPNPNSAITITATSAAATSPGTATVNLQTPTPAGTYPITVTVTEGSVQHTTTFSLTVD